MLRRRRRPPERPVDVHRGAISFPLEPDFTREELRELRWVEVPDENEPEGIYYAEEPVNRWGPFQ
jgi:hypothetical protein